jgi:hypothetical protein
MGRELALEQLLVRLAGYAWLSKLRATGPGGTTMGVMPDSHERAMVPAAAVSDS